MQPQSDSMGSAPTLSLAARLQQRCGADVDPRIDLDSARQLEPASAPPSAASPPSSSTLKRLEERTAGTSRYLLRGEIARGGMGAILEVFDADLRRRLAMKVILDRQGATAAADSGSIDPRVLARFLEEAQVTGQLDHPGIVPVHELGIDEQGRVYFTMRLVHGRHLEHIFALAAKGLEGWSMTRALGVLQKVCEAMAYAHEKGVVHRDLKPQNVMVGRFGEVYVMDWGLARVRNQTDRHDIRVRAPLAAPSEPRREGAPAMVETDRRDESGRADQDGLCTMDGDVVGTPSYMAPEQARGEVSSIDERTDVYAVGAMLYRLLAGVAPYTERAEQTSGAAIWERVMAGPPASLDAIAKDAPVELAAICGKAMARAPGDRYPGMQELAEELRAFLEGRVVHAFETGALAEAKKWVRRNRGLAAALAAAGLALVAGLTGSLVFAGRARESARVAEARRVEAAGSAALAEQRRGEAAASALLAEQRRTEADRSAAAALHQARVAEQVNSFLNDDLLASIAPEHQGKDVTVRQVLDGASASLVVGFANDPEVEAALRRTIGISYQRLGEFESARRHLERALDLRREQFGARAELTLVAMRDVAGVWGHLGRNAEAIALYEEALEIAQEMFGAGHRATTTTRNDLAIVLSAVGRLDEARAQLEATLSAEERLLGDDHDDTLVTRNNLALALQRQGRFAEAESMLREVLERRLATVGERHPETQQAMNNLAQVLRDRGQLDESEELSRRSLELRRELFGPDHPTVASTIGNLGTIVGSRGRNAEAEALFREAMRIHRLRSDEDTAEVLLAKHNLAASIDDPARRDEALALRREVVDGRRRLLGAEHPDTLESTNGLAVALKDAAQYAEAEALYRQVIEVQRRVLGPDHPSTLVTCENLGGLFFTKRDYAASEELVREVLAGRRRALGERHPDVAKTGLNLAMVLKARGDTSGALQVLDEALAVTRAAYGDGHLQTAEGLRTMGDLRNAAKEHTAALAAYGESLEIRRKLRPDDADAAYLIHQIAVQHYLLEDFASALLHFEAAVPLRERLSGPDALGTRLSLLMQARTLLELRRFEDAAASALDAAQRTARAEPAGSENVASCRRLLVRIYEAWNKPDEAAKWR